MAARPDKIANARAWDAADSAFGRRVIPRGDSAYDSEVPQEPEVPMAKRIMFVHGMFQNGLIWEGWCGWFAERGYECHAPDWPMHEGDPAKLRRSPPAGLGKLRLEDVISRMAGEAQRHEASVLIGHSLGGWVVQRLVAAGVGSRGIPICSVPPNQLLAAEWARLEPLARIADPQRGDALAPMDADAFHRTFANTLPRALSDAAFERYAMSESRNVLRDVLGGEGNVDPEAQRVPLLFVAAERDAVIPPWLCQKNADLYAEAGGVGDYREFAGRGHFICREPGWEDVAAFVLEWIERNAQSGDALIGANARPSPFHVPG